MSKSRGGAVDPIPLIEAFGVDPLRYFLLREMVFGQDANFSDEAFIDRVNTDLANDLGNLLSRTLKMIEDYSGGRIPKTDARFREDEPLKAKAREAWHGLVKDFDELDFSAGLGRVWDFIGLLNRFIVQNEPWKLSQDPGRRWALDSVLYTVAEGLRIVAILLVPVMPRSAAEIWKRLGIRGDVAGVSLEHFTWGELKSGLAIARGDSLFPRIDKTRYLAEAGAGKKEAATETARPGPAARGRPDAPSDAPSSDTPSGATEVTIDEFARVDLRTAKVVAAEGVKGADKLLKLTVDLGGATRTIVAGIAARYPPESLVGKTIIVVNNLQPSKLRGEMSYGMLLAVRLPDGGLRLVTTDGPPTGRLRLSEWLARHESDVGQVYASEMDRHYRER